MNIQRKRHFPLASFRNEKWLLLLGWCLIPCLRGAFAQQQLLNITPANSTIILDGHLDEGAWQSASQASDFQLNAPYDSLPATAKTVVRLTYDKHNLYIGATCYDANSKDFVIQTLKRDFDLLSNDAFAIVLDAFQDENSGLIFAVNPYGVQLDGIIPRGGTKDLSLIWDGLWNAEVFQEPLRKRWSVEIAIPFKTLRYSVKTSRWNINFIRNDRGRNQISSWAPVPRGFNVYTLGYLGVLDWKDPPGKQGHHISLIPFMVSKFSKDYQSNNIANLNFHPGLGLDAKIALNTSFNLDLAINPDFSQVEVDRQVVDLDRFEISFPEKRLFFLENSDLFSGLGNSRIRPFFSRRIGSLERLPIPIRWGGRLSGKIKNNWRVGLMSLQTEAKPSLRFGSQNYTVATIERRLNEYFWLSTFVANRQAFSNSTVDQHNFNRVAGLELDFISPDSKWTGKAFAHRAFQPVKRQQATAFSAKARYTTREMSFFLGLDGVQENYKTDLGFVPRLYHENQVDDSLYQIPYLQFRSNGYYRIYPKYKNQVVEYYGPTFSSNLFTGHDLDYQEHDFSIGFLLRLLNSTQIELTYNDYAPKLFFPFLLNGLQSAFLPGNYPSKGISLSYTSDDRKPIHGKACFAYGGEYMGNLLNFAGEISFRTQPWGVFSFNFSHQNLSDFPDKYGSPSFNLAGAKLELAFRRNIFLTTFLQYNTQDNNFNLNARFRWEIKRMSNIYLVYTDNYQIDQILVKNRALILKLTYWLNL